MSTAKAIQKALRSHRAEQLAKRYRMPRKPKSVAYSSLLKRGAFHEQVDRDLTYGELEKSRKHFEEQRSACRAARDRDLDVARTDCARKKRELAEECAAERSRARVIASECVATADHAHQDDLASYYRSQPKKSSRTNRRAIEAIRESDDAVRAELELGGRYELVPLWERVKGQIRARRGMSRAEAFDHYVHEHPGEVQAARDRQQARTEGELMREQAAAAAAAGDEEAERYLAELEQVGTPGRRASGAARRALGVILEAVAAADTARNRAHKLAEELVNITGRRAAKTRLAAVSRAQKQISGAEEKALRALSRLNRARPTREEAAEADRGLDRIKADWAAVYRVHDELVRRFDLVPF